VSGTVDWRGRFIGFYSGMGKAYAPQYRALFDDLKQNKTPLLFHCTAGKDRTGVGAALVLLALGVPKDTVLNDYHLTEEYINAAPPTAMARLPELSLAPAAVKAADPDYLNAALAGIDRDYGSLNNYFEMALGVSAADREQLRARYVDPESTTPARSQYK
jgi:protein-tyrosine phosphatase